MVSNPSQESHVSIYKGHEATMRHNLKVKMYSNTKYKELLRFIHTSRYTFINAETVMLAQKFFSIIYLFIFFERAAAFILQTERSD